MPKPRYFLPFRRIGNKKAIIFLHGLEAKVAVWTPMAKLLMADPQLADWDMFSLGYRATVQPTLFWEGSSLDNQCELLYSNLILPPVSEYESLAFVAHSAGGLVLQRALVDFDDVLQQTSHVFFFGTPSTGSHRARTWRFLNTGLRDMASGSRFVQRLRQDWKAKFPGRYPFHFELAAGDQDSYVRAASVRQPFPAIELQVVHGNHESMIMPASATDPAFQIVRKGLQQPRPEPAQTKNASEVARRSGKIFVSYSHEDAEWLMSITEMLTLVLGRDSLRSVWDDRVIQAGEEWRKRIEETLEQAGFAVLLITPSFLASSFIRGTELPRLLKRQQEHTCRLFPIMVSPVDYNEARVKAVEQEDQDRDLYDKLASIQFANEPKRPLTEVKSGQLVRELTRIANTIKSSIEQAESGRSSEA